MRVAIVLTLLLVACTGAGEETTTTATSDTTPPSTTFPTTSAPTQTTGATSSNPVNPLAADTILHNGTVITLDADTSITTGLAISGDRIVAVGDGENLLARAPDALALDLEGRAVIPGIVDPHIHLEQHQTPDLDNMLEEEKSLIETGRTTLGVPAINSLNLEGYFSLRDSGKALVRNHLYLSVNAVCGEIAESEGWWKEYEFDRSAEHRITIGGVKLFSDGGACNAPALSFEWIDGTNGDLYVDAARVADVLRQADQEGALVVVHSIGDRALRVVLDGFEQALGGDNPNRHRIDHNTLVPEDQIDRYGQTGANFVGWAWFNSCLEQTGNGWGSLGDRHLLWLRRHKEIRETNPDIRVAWHSDAPHSPTNIFEQLLSLTTFISLNETGEPCPAPPWMSGREVSIETALRMMTIDAAAVMDLDGDLGSLEVGKIADLAILNKNPLEQEGMELLQNRVDSTWISGRAVWCDGWTACGIAPALVDRQQPGSELTVTASSSRAGQEAELAFDDDATGDSFWSSGDDPPGWIQVDFDEPRSVAGVRMTVFQNPPSDTLHVLELVIDGSYIEVARFERSTQTGEVLEWAAEDPIEQVEGVRVTTLESLSWPEWYEIEVLP